jgi:hypothetical protein
MAVDKHELLTALKRDLKAAETTKKLWDSKRADYKAAHDGEPYGNEVEGRSRIVSREIKKQSSWSIPALVDPFVSSNDVIKCHPITAEDTLAARQNELLLNTQFCRKFNRYNFMNKAISILDVQGTVVIQTGWEYEDSKVMEETETVAIDEYGNEYITTEEVEQTIVKKNQPTAKVCRNEDIYIDPTCEDDMDKCQFIIYRYETDISTLRKDGRYKNLERVESSLGTTTHDADYRPEDKTRYQFGDNPRKKLIVHEYWGNYDVDEDGEAEAIVCAWIGNTIIRLQGNPYPDGKPPFIIVPYNAVPFQMFGEANAELVGDNQKIKTAIIRGIIDNMAQSNNGQIGIRKGTLDIVNRKKLLQGKNFEYNGDVSSIWQGSYNPIPSSAFDMIALMNNEIESLTGTKSFSGGISGNSLGTMLDINTDVPMIDGSVKLLGDIVDGDVIVGSNGKGTTVVKAHEIAYPKQAYDMVFGDSTVIKSGGEHLWTIKVFGTKHRLIEWHTVDADTVYAHLQAGRRVVVPKMREVHTGTRATSTIDPYVLGYWLGDGMSYSASITTMDYEVVEYFNAAGYQCVPVKGSSKCEKATMYDVYKHGVDNGSLHGELRELNLLARYEGGGKHVPEMFMTATYEEKMELIRGLMDSNGYHHGSSFVQFAQSESRLKDDVIKLLGSLGLAVSTRVKDMDKINEAKLRHSLATGTKMVWSRRDIYEIGFTPWSNPFKITRKAEGWNAPRCKTVRITSMTKVDNVLMRCLTVDSEDKLFAVTDRFILTHNTATSARGAMDAQSVRRMHIVRNIAENLIKPLLRKWMAYNSEFLEDEEVVRITNEQFVPVRRDDLSGSIDIDLSIATMEDQSAKSQELSFLLQTLGNTVAPEITQELMAQILELGRMPDQAKTVREFKPEPDKVQEQLKQLELQRLQIEIQKGMSEIKRNESIAAENNIDRQVKLARAARDEAQARLIHSNADKTDLEFLKIDSGENEAAEIRKEIAKLQAKLAEKDADHRYNLEHKVLDHKAKLDVEAVKAMQNDKKLEHNKNNRLNK